MSSTNVISHLASVQKLSGPKDYFNWVFQMRLILTCMGCWGVVNGAITKLGDTNVVCLLTGMQGLLTGILQLDWL
jgi:hypothetical protein